MNVARVRGSVWFVDTPIPDPPATDPRPRFAGSHEPPGDPEASLATVDQKLNRVIAIVEVGKADIEGLRDGVSKDIKIMQEGFQNLVGVYRSLADVVIRLERRINPVSFRTRAALIIVSAASGGFVASVAMRLIGASAIATALSSCFGSK